MSFPQPFYRWRPHPWHGLSAGREPPRFVRAYIEITPFDTIKYECDKETGYLRVDRPQRTSSQPPMCYGFIPRTYCGTRVGKLAEGTRKGDGDPLDICVVSERPINHADIIMDVRVIGGLQMIDADEADDKIIGVLENDTVWAGLDSISGFPDVLVERLIHYFNTYKLAPGQAMEGLIRRRYDREHAEEVIRAAMADYEDNYGS